MAEEFLSEEYDSRPVFAFGDYELDTQRYQLRRNTMLVEVEPKVFDLLIYLVHHRQRTVSREELLAQLWPGQVISDAALNRCVARARKAIGDDGKTQTSHQNPAWPGLSLCR